MSIFTQADRAVDFLTLRGVMRPFCCRRGIHIVKYLIVCLLFSSSLVEADISGVATVTDGDSIRILNVRIRLSGIDAPERDQKCLYQGAVWDCGHESTKMMQSLAQDKKVTCTGDNLDQYDRLIATCFVGDADINAQMVKNGMALAYRRYSLDYIEEENIARYKKLGIWASKFVFPWDWRAGKRLANGI